MRYNDYFSSLGAGVIALYFLGAVVFTVIGLHPVLLGLSFLSALAYYGCTAGVVRALKSLGAVVPFLLLYCVVNPLLNNRGATELFRLWGRSVTLESVLYGLLSSLMLLCVLLWFGCMQQSLDSDRLTGLLSGVLPVIGLMLGLILRFIPYLRSLMTDLTETQRTLGVSAGRGGLRRRMRTGGVLLSAALSLSLEETLDTAVSMRARGFELRGRRRAPLRFQRMGAGACAAVLACAAGVTAAFAFGLLRFSSMPTLSRVSFSPLHILAYALCGLYFNIPLLYNAVEDARWKYSQSKI